MNSTTLHALIIDQHFGELSPEATDLLQHYLDQNADARAEAQRVLRSLAATEHAVLRHPELVAPQTLTVPSVQHRVVTRPWLQRAAAAVLLAATAAGGFLAGRASHEPTSVVTEQAPPVSSIPSSKPSPWARYRMAFNRSTNAMQIVRVDSTTTPESHIQ